MRKILSIVMFLGGVWVISAVTIFVFNDIQILHENEQRKIKEGKQFWQWYSEFGPIAVHYNEYGEGDNHLVLLHGFRSHSYTWQKIAEPLATMGHHVWAIDLVGFGLSDKPPHASYHVDFFARQIHDFMEDQGIEKAHFMGNSLGGGLSLIMALEYPSKVESLTLLAALGYPIDFPIYLAIGRYFESIWTPFLGPTMVREVLKQVVYDKDSVTEDQVAAYSLPYRFPGGIKTSLLTLQNFDNQRLKEMEKQYSFLKHPVLIIWGENDPLLPVDHYKKFVCDLPHAKELLIPQCGHIPQEEAPHEVLKAVISFLDGISVKNSPYTK